MPKEPLVSLKKLTLNKFSTSTSSYNPAQKFSTGLNHLSILSPGIIHKNIGQCTEAALPREFAFEHSCLLRGVVGNAQNRIVCVNKPHRQQKDGKRMQWTAAPVVVPLPTTRLRIKKIAVTATYLTRSSRRRCQVDSLVNQVLSGWLPMPLNQQAFEKDAVAVDSLPDGQATSNTGGHVDGCII